MAAERIATEQEASIIGQSNMSTTDLRCVHINQQKIMDVSY